MNLWFRLLFLLLAQKSRGRLVLPAESSRLDFRVMPHDIDLSFHMNNGRYLALMDLGRLDLMLRSGLWRHVWRQRWTPVASAVAIRFRRELRPFQAFRLESRIVYWNTAVVVIEQSFRMAGGSRDGELAARALFKGGIYNRRERRFVQIAHLMHLIGIDAEAPPPSQEVEVFLSADEALKATTTAETVSF